MTKKYGGLSKEALVVREVLRHYLELEAYAADTGEFVLEHGNTLISFLDLQGKLKELAPRKREAVFLNVILDKKQKDVAEIMGITTVSVGQYVNQAATQLAKHYFPNGLEE